jgi:uncharacterized protein YodC (DUF2158 family)
MTKAHWKSGSRVKVSSGNRVLAVVGYDSVGSVICRPIDNPRHSGVYVTPSLLVDAEVNASGRSTD